MPVKGRYFMKEATLGQITGYLRRAPFKFVGSKPSKSEVKGALGKSSIFDSYKNSNDIVMYKLKEEYLWKIWQIEINY